MDVAHLLYLLEDKDTSVAYRALKELEKLSDDSDALYPHIDMFISMMGSEQYVIRVRGFRLFCKQAKWDTERVIDRHLDVALRMLSDDKPTAVRQALAALVDLVPYKPHLGDQIRARVCAIDYLRYKDTMHGLIAKDMQALLARIDEQ